MSVFAAACVALTLMTGGCPPDTNLPDGGTDNPSGPLPIPPDNQPGSGNQNNAPTLTFQWPTQNLTIQDGTDVMIRFTGADVGDTMRVNVFADFINTTVTPPAQTTIVLAQGRQLASPLTSDAYLWTTAGALPATYTIRATITDQVNPAVTVIAPGQITIIPRVPPGGPPVGNPVPPPNISPTLRLVSPAATGVQLQQGEQLTIIWETADADDPVTINVNAALNDPIDPQSLVLVNNLVVAPGTQRKQTVWNLTGVPTGDWEVTIRARESGVNPPNPDPDPVVFPVRVVPPGSGTQNSPPTVNVTLPTTDAGLTDGDTLTMAILVSDPNLDTDTLTLTFLLDRDNNPNNDANQPPVEIGGDSVPSGTFPPGVQVLVAPNIVIDGANVPVRDDTDEGGQPLPYFVRVKVEDGRGGVVNGYAVGKVRILTPAEDMVDLLEIGGRVGGSRWQGFNGDPFSEGRGARAGYSFAGIGDFNLDGINDFVVVARTASPFTFGPVGMAYLVYGRPRSVDPTLGIAQGRYSGIVDLNTVGSFASFPPEHPFHEFLWNVRGTQFYHPAVGPGGGDGITSVVGYPDITGDGIPELVFGSPRSDTVADLKDNDPCDNCAFPIPAPFPLPASFTSYITPTREVLDVDAQGFPTNVNIPAGTWRPADPTAVGAGFANVDLDLDDQRVLLSIVDSPAATGSPFPAGRSGLEVCFDLEGTSPTAITVPVQVQIDLQLEPSVDRGDGTMIHGPCLRRTITLITDPNDTTAPFDLVDPATGQPFSTQCGSGAANPMRYRGGAPEFPVALDATGNVGNGNCSPTGANTPPIANQPVPPSCYDGRFALFFRWLSTANLTLRFSATPKVVVNGITAQTQPHPFAFTYLDGYPDVRSNDTSCATESPSPVDLFLASELPPACGPANDDRFSGSGISGYMALGPFRVGNGLPPPGGLFGGINGPEDDNMSITNPPGVDPPSAYQSGLAFLGASDGRQLPFFGNGAAGTPNRRINLGDFGQGPRGARFRGAWYQTEVIYDPNSRFGETLDTLPDMNFSSPGLQELIVSAPGAGECSNASMNMTALMGDYTAAAGTSRLSRWNYLDPQNGTLTSCSDVPWVFENYSRVLSANLVITGTANRAARIQTEIFVDTPFGPAPVPGTQRVVLFWGGGVTLPTYVNAVFPFEPPFSPPVAMGFPRGALNLFAPVNGEASGLWVGLTVLPDANATGSSVTPSGIDGGPSVTITSAVLTVNGLAPDVGMVQILDGVDWTNPELAQLGDTDDGIASWPFYFCQEGTAPFRFLDFGVPPVAEIHGNFPKDQFGWAKRAGDLDLDGIPDFACGAPGADTDPDNAGGAKLPENGQSFVFFGTPVFPQTPMAAGPPLERFEVRGSHAGDAFGKAQGSVGDFNGDQNGDVYIGAEQYDFTGPVAPGDNMPSALPGETLPRTNCGFVGIMFGNPSLTGEVTVRAERIGSGNFFGCKFIGGFAGARLGQAVSDAGDFNQDGNGDILITAPGQQWPAVSLAFKGNVANGQQVVINGVVFEFDTDNVPSVAPGAIRVDVRSGQTAQDAQRELVKQVRTVPRETINVSAIASRLLFPEPLPDDPTITFLPRQPIVPTITTTVPAGSLTIKSTVRQGVAYLIFGGNTTTLNLTNKTFTLPQDLNRRSVASDVTSPRVLRGMVFVSAFEVDQPGDVDGDGLPGFFANFETNGIGITHPAVGQLATISGGSQQVPPASPGRVLVSPTPAGSTQGYVVTNGTPATISFNERPACEVTAFFVFDPASGATGATMTAFNPQGQVVSVVQASAAPQNPPPAIPGRPGPPPAAVNAPWVRILQPGAIASITITVQGAAGARAILDDLWLQDPTPDGAPVESVAGIGDVDADGVPDIMLGAPSADVVNIFEPCNRRKSAGEAYLIHGNSFGFNNATLP